MIVDTSALMCTVLRERGDDSIKAAMLDEDGLLPTPAYVEFLRVATGTRAAAGPRAEALLALLLQGPIKLLPFTPEHARVAAGANARYGTGNGQGGPLNMLDLMVYACAKVTGRPVLCTGRDFAATDVGIHPASRAD